MPRIRTLTAAGVVVGATVLGGAGLAAADMHEADDTQSTDVEEVVEVDENGEPIDADETEEVEDVEEVDETEELDETDDVEDVEETDDVEETEETEETEDAGTAQADNHGQYVSGVAQSTEPGPDHGATVAAAAQEQRDAKQAERQGETDETAEVEDDAGEREQGRAPQAAAGKGR